MFSDGYDILVKADAAVAFLSKPKSAEQLAVHLKCHRRSALRLLTRLEQLGLVRKTAESRPRHPALYRRAAGLRRRVKR